MKKSFKLLKVACVVGLLTVLGVTNGYAQGLRTSYFMDNVPARLKMNPALQPARGYFNIPTIGALGLSISSNKLSIDDFVDIIENKNGFLESDKFMNRLDSKNTMNIDFTTDILSFGFYSGKGFWTVNLGARAIVSASIPKTMFEFARYAEIDLGQEYDIRNMELHADVFSEIGLGYSRPVTDKLNIGGRFKVLIGVGNLDAKIDKIYVNAGSDMQKWEVTTKGKLEASMKGLKLEYDSEHEYINDIDIDSPGISGFGFGIDLGASYKILNNLTVSAAILDLGFINWSKSHTTIATTEGSHTYGEIIGSINPDDYDPNDWENINPDDYENYISNTDIFDLDLIQFQEGEAKSRKTTLRSTLNIGAEITLLNNKLGFGVLSSTQFTLPSSYSELTVSANYRPRNWFGATLSYSFLHSEFKTVGIGLKLGPIFIGSDYLMTKAPGDANRANAYVGCSIPLGKKRLDYRR
ncbi:DUF5723 family protein [Butyricimonas hominis]|uniref:DUF5723 domain-containing protein n=1 Tax=Butyricimonas hominis TaxID=2763032 RepID=A0ABR7CYM6_9BACT|nr:DUF5723 family protein [Butyricimonas hominis]MBC5620780.1 hypothetical protein [Butyricimonas hominis]